MGPPSPQSMEPKFGLALGLCPVKNRTLTGCISETTPTWGSILRAWVGTHGPPITPEYGAQIRLGFGVMPGQKWDFDRVYLGNHADLEVHTPGMGRHPWALHDPRVWSPKSAWFLSYGRSKTASHPQLIRRSPCRLPVDSMILCKFCTINICNVHQCVVLCPLSGVQ
jgi:hypothetical protein